MKNVRRKLGLNEEKHLLLKILKRNLWSRKNVIIEKELDKI